MGKVLIRGKWYDTLERDKVSIQINKMIEFLFKKLKEYFSSSFTEKNNSTHNPNNSYISFRFTGESNDGNFIFYKKNYPVNHIFEELSLDMLYIKDDVLNKVCNDRDCWFDLYFEYEIVYVDLFGNKVGSLTDLCVNGPAFIVK